MYQRPTLITVLAVLNFISAPLMLLAAALVVTASLRAPDAPDNLMMGIAAVYGIFGVLTLFCGIGLWNLRGYGRTLQIAFSFLGLIAFPVGTLISVLILIYLFKPGAKVLFSEKPVARLSPWEIEQAAQLHQSSAALVVVLVFVALLAVVAFIGIIAAIAIPSLLRARVSANEAAAIGDVRAVIQAESLYAAANGGFYDRLECLAKPSECIPGYPSQAPVFLSELYPPVKSGFEREFLPGIPAPGGERWSTSSLTSFAFIAYPASPGLTGTRSFCGDQTGRICVQMDGGRPAVTEVGCDPSCTPLQ